MSSDKSPEAAARRANDFGSSYLNQPGYADDSMFFVLRYGHQTELQMCKADLKRFNEALTAYNKAAMEGHKDSAGGASSNESIVERTQRIKALRATAIETLKDHPELERDFDRYVAAIRSMFKAVNSK
jgi:hypothetical protein